MGATVVTGKSAAAFRASNGEIIYVLFEETYEKNCYPHTPNWGCRAVGRIDSVIKRIFASAGACEGGMLQRRGGALTPEGYIRSWLKELESPRVFPRPGMTLELKVGDTFLATVPSESAERAFGALERIGRVDVVDKLRNGEGVSITLDEDVDIVDALYGQPGALAAWRIVSEVSRGTVVDATLGYKPRKATGFDVFEPEALQLDEHRYLLKGEDGMWRCAGWAYAVVGRYITGLAESELREPGSYSKRIKAYRDAFLKAAPAPRGMKVVVDQGIKLASDYERSRVYKFAEQNPVHRTASGYEVAVDELRQDGTAMYDLGALPVECAKWVLPATQGVDAPAEHQMALFAA